MKHLVPTCHNLHYRQRASTALRLELFVHLIYTVESVVALPRLPNKRPRKILLEPRLLWVVLKSGSYTMLDIGDAEVLM